MTRDRTHALETGIMPARMPSQEHAAKCSAGLLQQIIVGPHNPLKGSSDDAVCAHVAHELHAIEHTNTK